MSLGLTFLKPLLLPLVKFLVGKFLTQQNVRDAIDVVFADLHQIVDKLPTHGTALSALEKNVDKDALAAEVLAFLETKL